MYKKFYLKTMLLLLALIVGSGSAWAQTSSIEINTTNSGVTGSYQDKEFDVNDITFKFTQWMKSTNIQAKKSTSNSLYNIDAIPGTITSIEVVQTGTARAITLYGGTSEKPTTQITSPSTAATMTFNFSGKNYNYFSLTTPGNACYFDKITIYYTPSGGTPSPSLTVDPATIAFNDKAINGTYSETFDVIFANLTQDLSVSVGSGLTGVTVSPTTIASNATSPQTVTVSYAPKAAGSISGDITVSNTDDEVSQTVAVTGSAYDPANVVTFERYTGPIVEGDYIIYNTNGAMQNTLNNGSRFNNESVTVTNNTITNPPASIIWHIAPFENTEYWTIYNAAVGKYAGGTTSKNQGALLDEVTDHAKWKIYYPYTTSTNPYIENYGRSQDSSDSGNKYLRQNTTATTGWATYGLSGYEPNLYKKVVTNQVATPTFSPAAGTYTSAQSVTISTETEGATIYYTTDGTDPTAESTPYKQAITISATTTLKAIAVKGEDVSNIATATYTFPLIYQTIAEFKAAYTTGYLNMSGAQVVYIDSDKKNIYVRDNSGAVDIYNGGGFTTEIKTGDFLGGVLYGEYSPYNKLPEIKNADLSNVTITGNEVVVAKVIEGTTEAIEANLCDLVKIQSTQIKESNNSYYVGDNKDIKLYDNFHVGLTFETDMDVDVQGIASIYNDTYELFPRYAEDIVYLENSVPVSISAAGMATFCSNQALDFTAVDAIHAYYVNVDNSGNLTFTRIRKIPANTGVLLRNAQGEDQGAVETINVPVLSGEAESVNANAFVAVLEEIAQLASNADGFNNYILNKKDGRLGFYLANKQKVGAGKAYLRIDESIEAREFFGFNEGEATSISTIDNGQLTMENAYNLQGQKVGSEYKGIVIVNGKKFINK